MPNPKIFTLSAPSGTGKNTVLDLLLASDLPISRMKTMTSRPTRSSDKPDEYIFATRDEFLSAIDRGDMIEWVEYNNNLYGTRHSDLKEILDAGRSPIMQIDVRGARSFKDKFPNAVSLFLSPGSLEILRRRLVARGMKESDIEERLETAKYELSLAPQFDHQVVNYDGKLEDTIEDLKRVINAELQAE